VAELLKDVVGAHAYGIFGSFPRRSFSKMSLVLTPYGIFGSSASEKIPCKSMKESISSNNIA
jgi:hypothetical protein